MNNFTLSRKSKKSKARLSTLKLAHGKVSTPFFMPIATKGAVKTLSIDEVQELKPEILLSNTYHLYLQPGLDLLKKFGGLHKFMNWDKPILTDSGGFQVFSLSKIRKVKEDGVEFQSHLDGSKHLLTPEKVVDIQKIIGSDIMMVLDQCIDSTSDYTATNKAMEITTRWATRARKYFLKKKIKDQLQFGIVQGALFEDLRKQSALELSKLNFDGYAIGGLAVGETNDEMYKVLDYIVDELPADKPRYLMGVGKPENIVEAVKRGVDMFDCVIPTREARHGRLYIWKNQNLNSKNFYQTINISNEKFKADKTAINKDSKIPALRSYTRGYLSHLFKTQEPLALKLATLNNVEFYLELMRKIRTEIGNGKL